MTEHAMSSRRFAYTACMALALAAFSSARGAEPTLSYTTREASWLTPQVLATRSAPSAYFPSVSSSGETFAAAWQHESDTIALRRYTPRTGWSDLALLDTNSRSYIEDPRVFLDEAGTAHVIWINNSHTLESARHTIAGGWSPVERVFTGTGSVDGIRSYDGGMDSAGNIAVMWNSEPGDIGEIWANRYVPGSGWGKPVRLSNPFGRSARLPKLAVAAAGNVMATWQEQVGSDTGYYYQLWSRHYTPAGDWGPAARIDVGGTMNTAQAQITIDDAGYAIAVYTSTTVMTNTYDPATGWGTPTRLDNMIGSGVDPQIAMLEADLPSVAWIHPTASSYELWLSRQLIDRTWSAPERIATAASFYQYLQLVRGAGGEEIILAREPAAPAIVAIRHKEGRGWVTETLELPGASSQVMLQVGVDRSGGALALWFGQYPDRYTVESSVLE